ncbi:hypothetical protein LMH87_002862 [Akanthomyces muscarius]|uniref:Uncharacterized protein n=1 Tax=Akanthomyces muscarius TaxID=2231603 RepID=A0A9W8UJV9_AKAMU|nr:hypothetical protein LMH87_002862 [Akanthomyces muscarius]KAJ4148389.1 hypothetical protein LMH87_002862 [Akanthomyces muscarius]
MSRYTAAHQWDALAGPGDARPTAEQIIKDLGAKNTLASKIILITGVSSGIGAATAAALAATGATIVGAGRSIPKAKAALSAIANYPRLHLLQLDLASSASIKKFASDFLQQFHGLNILINNAGGILAEHSISEDGVERQCAMNYLGQFQLFGLLKDALLASATAGFPSRVVNVSSTGHKRAPLQDDLGGFFHVGKEEYDPMRAYCRAKTASVYMAGEIERRYGARDLHAWSVHPGAILASAFLDSSGFDQATVDQLLDLWPEKYFKSNEQGAATQVWAAVGADVLQKDALGRYLEDVSVAVPAGETPWPEVLGYAEHTYDEGKAARLWELSEEKLAHV